MKPVHCAFKKKSGQETFWKRCDSAFRFKCVFLSGTELLQADWAPERLPAHPFRRCHLAPERAHDGPAARRVPKNLHEAVSRPLASAISRGSCVGRYPAQLEIPSLPRLGFAKPRQGGDFWVQGGPQARPAPFPEPSGASKTDKTASFRREKRSPGVF
jgi:hypothetical protein